MAAWPFSPLLSSPGAHGGRTVGTHWEFCQGIRQGQEVKWLHYQGISFKNTLLSYVVQEYMRWRETHCGVGLVGVGGDRVGVGWMKAHCKHV